jgi:hypothetical protein
MRILLRAILCLALAWGAPAAAVIIASGDGTGNTSAPLDDPGWDSVGKRHIFTGVYLGDAWVLTADHVGEGDIIFAGTLRRAVPGSGVQLLTDGVDPADLLLFRVESDPAVPAAAIASDPPSGELVMIGQGRNRGAAINWMGIDGWAYGAGRAMRWGTNEVEATSRMMSDGVRFTVCFSTDLSEGLPTEHEAQAAGGDSGGAVFAMGSEGWELAGIMVTVIPYVGQPAQTVLYGNETWSAQLADYRDQILSIMAGTAPACADGMDDDGDGLIDHPDDPGCDDELDPFETSDTLPCDDGSDNDGDGRIDFDPATFADPGDETQPPGGLGDPGCHDPSWISESPECQDGSDNDGDGLTDYDGGLSANGFADPAGPDPECTASWKKGEAPSPYPCGLGAELALALPLLIWMRRRRR